jgi:hypothetical protein
MIEMTDITQQSPRSGNLIDENGSIRNIVDLLGGGTPVSDKVVDPTIQAAKTGRVIGPDGRIYNLVNLIDGVVDLIRRLSIIHRDLGVTTTALYDGATTNPIMIDGVSTTAVEGDLVFYNGEDFVYNHEGIWLSVTSAFGRLAYMNMVNYNTDITNKPTLGTAAAQNVEAFATAAQGTKADNAIPNAGNETAGGLTIVRNGTISISSDAGNTSISGRTTTVAGEGVVNVMADGVVNVSSTDGTTIDVDDPDGKLYYTHGGDDPTDADEVATAGYVDAAIAAITDYDEEAF